MFEHSILLRMQDTRSNYDKLSKEQFVQVDYDIVMNTYEQFQPTLLAQNTTDNFERYNNKSISHKFLLQRHFKRLIEANKIVIGNSDFEEDNLDSSMASVDGSVRSRNVSILSSGSPSASQLATNREHGIQIIAKDGDQLEVSFASSTHLDR